MYVLRQRAGLSLDIGKRFARGFVAGKHAERNAIVAKERNIFHTGFFQIGELRFGGALVALRGQREYESGEIFDVSRAHFLAKIHRREGDAGAGTIGGFHAEIHTRRALETLHKFARGECVRLRFGRIGNREYL